MRYKTEIQLLNPTNKKWDLYKSIDKKIVNLLNKHGINIIKSVYDNKLFIKTILLNDNNDVENKIAIFEEGNLLGNHKLKMKIISRIEVLPTVKKIKYLIKLTESTPYKWTKYLASELHINKLANDENIVRENIFYNKKDFTLSVEVEYPDEKSRENLNHEIGEYLNNIGLHQEVIEATRFDDYCDNIIDLPIYSANKLMDQAVQSLDKLSHM